MGDLIAAGKPWGICIASDGDKYALIVDSGSMEMWKEAGSGWTSVGTDQSYSDVHGKNATTIQYAAMVIDSSDILHVTSQPNVDNAGTEIAYRQFSTSTDEWTGSWVEIADIDTYYSIAYHTMICDPSDNIWVAWSDLDSKGGNVNVTTDQSGSWATTNIGSGDVTELLVSIGCDSSGNIHAFWRNSTLGGDWSYRQWTSGGGWGTVYQENVVNLPYRHNVVEFGSAVYDAGLISNNVYLKDKSNTATDTLVNTSTAYDFILQTVYGGEHFLICIESISSQYRLRIYEGSGASWDLRGMPAETGVNFFCVAAPYGGGDYVGVEVVYGVGTNAYYYQEFGTPVSDSITAFAKMGGQPTSSQDAWLMGDPHRSSRSAFIEGYTDGVSVRHAYSNAMWPEDSRPAFLKGDSGIVVDVVNFTCPSSTGTQNITGSLNGLTPKAAIFMSTCQSTNDTEGNVYQWLVGITDGVNEYCNYYYYGVGGGAGDCIVSDARCINISKPGSYNLGEFSSWLTNGIQLNWTQIQTGGGEKCAVMLFAETVENSMLVECAYALMNWPDVTNPETISYTGMSWKPDFLMTIGNAVNSLSNISICAQKENNDGSIKRIFFSHTDSSSRFSAFHTDQDNWNFYNWGDEEYGSSYISQFTETGWDAVKEFGTSNHQYYYLAFKFANGFAVDFDLFDLSGGTGNKDFAVNLTPKAVLALNGQPGTLDTLYYNNRYTCGGSMWDNTDEYCFGCRHDTSTNEYGVVDDSCVLLLYDSGGSKYGEANHSSFSAGKFTLNITNSSAQEFFAIAFGEPLDDFSSSTPAYINGAAHTAPAMIWGSVNTTSAQGAFFHVVDAQTSIPCWMTGLNPARTDQAAYMLGVDDPMIIAVPFTSSSGTQQITDARLGGLTPKAALFFVTGKDSSSVAIMSVGITDGTNQHCKSIDAMNDTTSPYLGGYSVNVDKVIAVSNGYTYDNAGNYCTAAFSQWLTNGVEISWSGSYAGMHGVVYLFAGDNISAKCENAYMNTGTGSYNITAPGFEPDTVFILGYYTQDNLSDTDQNGDVILQTYVNDGHSPYPTNMFYYMGGSNYGFGDCYPCPDWSPEMWAYDTMDTFLSLTAFISTGFTIYQGYSGDMSASTFPYLAIKHSGRKSHCMWATTPLLGTGEREFTRQPEGYNIYPESAFVFSAALRKFLYGGSEPYYRGFGTYGFHFLGAGTNYTSISASENDKYDCISQYEDRICKSEEVTNYQIRGIWRYYTGPREWRDTIRANLSFVRNGWILDVDYVETEYYDFATDFTTLGFIFGTFDIYDQQSAYLAGRKVNWPGRTPMGCFLEGTIATASSSQSAFLWTWQRSNQVAFCEGYLNNTSSKAAFLRGSLDTSDNQVAYLYGSANVSDNQTGYTNGTGLPISSKHVFMRGKEDTASSQSAWSQAALTSSDNQSAYLRNGWDTSDQQSAFLEGIPIRTSQGAYAEAAFDGVAWWSIPAFLAGDGVWPFSDDFSLNDGESWDEIKWITEI